MPPRARDGLGAALPMGTARRVKQSVITLPPLTPCIPAGTLLTKDCQLKVGTCLGGPGGVHWAAPPARPHGLLLQEQLHDLRGQPGEPGP